ncbi:MAG: hypothetical protein GXP54_09390 [Deltaproteobacteria bacterium]|nr:hypothetical protein [Deltaproteobacteria bacterium]
MTRGAGILTVVCVLLFSGCRRSGSIEAVDAGPASVRDPGSVVATINGLPVMRADYEAALRAGRVGGAPELVMDEMLSFTLVLNECRAMGMGDACGGPGPMYARALDFLKRLYPAEKVCGEVKDEDLDKVMAGTRKSAKEGHLNRAAAREFICEARAKRIRRQWVRALRKNAVIRMMPKMGNQRMGN